MVGGWLAKRLEKRGGIYKREIKFGSKSKIRKEKLFKEI
jgi:hypothetical protein